MEIGTHVTMCPPDRLTVFQCEQIKVQVKIFHKDNPFEYTFSKRSDKLLFAKKELITIMLNNLKLYITCFIFVNNIIISKLSESCL